MKENIRRGQKEVPVQLIGKHSLSLQVVRGQGKLMDLLPHTRAFLVSGIKSWTAVTPPAASTAYGYSIRCPGMSFTSGPANTCTS